MILRILLVESDAEETLFLRELLDEMDAATCWSDFVHLETWHAETWSDAAAILTTELVDLVLLDLNLPDCQQADAFRRSQTIAPHVPVILLIEPSDVLLAERLLRDGAQDFLIKQQVDCFPLAHALRNAIERHRVLTASRAISIIDQLTGLMNRATFLKLAERDRKLADRLRCRLMVLVAEPANLNALASTYGDQRRDLAMVETADHLCSLASPADLIANIEGGRFAVDDFRNRFRIGGKSMGPHPYRDG